MYIYIYCDWITHHMHPEGFSGYIEFITLQYSHGLMPELKVETLQVDFQDGWHDVVPWWWGWQIIMPTRTTIFEVNNNYCHVDVDTKYPTWQIFIVHVSCRSTAQLHVQFTFQLQLAGQLGSQHARVVLLIVGCVPRKHLWRLGLGMFGCSILGFGVYFWAIRSD